MQRNALCHRCQCSSLDGWTMRCSEPCEYCRARSSPLLSLPPLCSSKRAHSPRRHRHQERFASPPHAFLFCTAPTYHVFVQFLRRVTMLCCVPPHLHLYCGGQLDRGWILPLSLHRLLHHVGCSLIVQDSSVCWNDESIMMRWKLHRRKCLGSPPAAWRPDPEPAAEIGGWTCSRRPPAFPCLPFLPHVAAPARRGPPAPRSCGTSPCTACLRRTCRADRASRTDRRTRGACCTCTPAAHRAAPVCAAAARLPWSRGPAARPPCSSRVWRCGGSPPAPICARRIGPTWLCWRWSWMCRNGCPIRHRSVLVAVAWSAP
mmetsp:Transcript_23423/g.65370  ORF Transcript_23423/g.65370 Transcript_23423/m.65370 type:complete len:317 (+) Transcript_23423:144-1094(+)